MQAVESNQSAQLDRPPCYLKIGLPTKRLPAVAPLFLLLATSLAGDLQAQSLFRKPVKVLGDPQYVGTSSNPVQFTNNGPNWTEGRELSFPSAVAVDTSVSPPNIYIADAGNNRILGFQYGSQTKSGAIADIIIGQVDKIANLTSAQNGRSTSLNLPSGLVVDSSGNLYVADASNNRVLRFPKPFQQNGQILPDLVIGQTSFSSKTANAGGVSATSLALGTGSIVKNGLAIDSQGSLWVADTNNHRVLRYPAGSLRGQPSNGPAADLVLGQADFVSRVAGASVISKTSMRGPQALAFDSGGRLFVSDSEGRILVFPASPQTNAPAVRLMGLDTKLVAGSVPVTQTQLNVCYGVASSAAGIIVADSQSNRVLLFPPFDSWAPEATQFSPSATTVVGQQDFFSFKANQGNADASSASFNFPSDVAVSGSELFVADGQNNRVLVFPSSAQGLTTTATRVLGQLDFPYTGVNLVDGKGFNLTGTVWGSAILDTSVTPARMYVADTQNNRVLGYKNFAAVKGGQAPDIVLGQPDQFRSVVNFPSGDPAKPSAVGLQAPTSLLVDSAGNLFVADSGNGRVVRFTKPFSSNYTNGQPADLVIGQASFTSVVTDASERNMKTPVSIALTSDAFDATQSAKGWLIVADGASNRVLFFAKPFVNGMAATKVLGAPDFTTTPPGSSDATKFSSPRGVAVDSQDRVLVADTGNKRVQIFNKAQQINNFDIPTISINTGLNQPVAISTGAPYTPAPVAGATSNAPSGFWVADLAVSAAIHFPSVDLLPLKNNAADGSVPVYGILSAYVDPAGNLLAADSVNRIVYFAPQATVNSAASYSTRPQAPGSIISLFTPSTSTSSIAVGTGAATALPLPTTLGDSQVLVNGTPAPLFYVSPGQVNMQLPSGLTGATADIQVVQVSTGQIVSGAEASLASASPALFTLNGSGSGQVIALNYASDGSYKGLNSSSNPILRGQVISLLGTGTGPVSGAPADGQAATGLAVTLSQPQVVIGSATTFLPDTNVQYSGLAPGLVGVWQVNILIPQTAQTGPSVPIKLFLNSVSNIDPNSTVQGSTTIAIQ